MMLYDIYGSMVLRLYGFMVNEFPFPSPLPKVFFFLSLSHGLYLSKGFGTWLV